MLFNMNEIKGFRQLAESQKGFFEAMLKKHHAVIGERARHEYTPISVQAKRGHLKVTFQNGEWLHYDYNGTWY